MNSVSKSGKYFFPSINDECSVCSVCGDEHESLGHYSPSERCSVCGDEHEPPTDHREYRANDDEKGDDEEGDDDDDDAVDRSVGK